jgi:hypothetical protein
MSSSLYWVPKIPPPPPGGVIDSTLLKAITDYYEVDGKHQLEGERLTREQDKEWLKGFIAGAAAVDPTSVALAQVVVMLEGLDEHGEVQFVLR